MIETKLGKYEIKRWLGGGQFGDVYLAQDTILNSEFALKVSRMREDEILMLKDEARLLSSLNHVNIVRFFNIDLIDGKFVLVVEYVKGLNLREIIRRKGRLEINRIYEITRQILTGLVYAHSLHVIHRDLKPENILINQEGIVKLTDFGLARFIKPGSISASSAGTPIYMAPEAWAGKFSTLSDSWSVAAILYEMITGRPPFISGNLEELRTKIYEGDLVPISTFAPEIPENIEQLIDSGLAPNPAHRPQPSEFLASLAETKQAITVSRVETPIESSRRKEIEPTPAQHEIIKDLSGPLLLFGAPGSGKTTTLTFGIMRKIEDGIKTENMLVVTFTNKASDDIRGRLKKSVLDINELENLWVGTFHFQALKILRHWAGRLDYSEDFEIAPAEEIVKMLPSPGVGKYRTKAILKTIGFFKAYGQLPDDVKPRSAWEKTCLDFYRDFVQASREKNVMDFDDLILYTLKLFDGHDDVKDYYAKKFQYVFVDELQDINLPQYQILRRLASQHHNIFFTGDEDQAIYGWRGARKELMYQVYKDFPDVRTFVLNRSFRLPEKIGSLAQNLILKNKNFKEHLIPLSKADPGELVVYPAQHENGEARFVLKEIENMAKKENRSYSDFAVLYRRHAQSRPFEEVLSKNRMPYSLIGGERFYMREEVKMLTDYLTGVARDDERLGVASIGRLLKLKDQEQEQFKNLITGGKKPDRTKKLRLAGKCYDILKSQIKEKGLLYPVQILDAVLTTSGAMKIVSARTENIKELIRVAQSFQKGELNQLLEHIRLIENLDLLDWGKNAVKLLTIHSAKGLEFPVVFLTGLVDSQFPMLKSLNDPKDLEEERRLCYVAITRVQEKLYLTYPKVYHGRHQNPSRFITDMLGK